VGRKKKRIMCWGLPVRGQWGVAINIYTYICRFGSGSLRLLSRRETLPRSRGMYTHLWVECRTLWGECEWRAATV